MESEACLELLDTDVSVKVSVTLTETPSRPTLRFSRANSDPHSSVILTHVLKKSKLLSVM